MTRRTRLLSAVALAGTAVALVSLRGPRPHPPQKTPGDQPAAAGFETFVLRTLAKRQIAREAAAGQRPLAEAAALFGELNRLPPRLEPAEHMLLPGATAGERLCRQVICYAGRAGPGWPPEAAAASAARLAAELDAELARHGRVTLPDAAGLPAAAAILERARAGLTDAQRRALLPGPPGPLPPE